MPTLHVIIPFYNEAETVQQCVRRVIDAPIGEDWRKSIVIVDDCSDDSSHGVVDSLVRELQSGGCDVSLHRHVVNQGKGTALTTGFDVVLKNQPAKNDLVIIQDADLEYDPADFRRLMEPIIAGESDAVVGTRWGAHHPIVGLRRRLHRWGNGILTACSNLVTGNRVNDMECCYKVFSVGLLGRLRPWLSEPRFGIEPQIMASLSRIGATISDVPISYDPRSIAAGKKIDWIDALAAVRVIVRERFRRAPGGNCQTNEPEQQGG